MTNWYADYVTPLPPDLQRRIERDAAIWEQLNAQRPCFTCGHRADYHGENHCGQEVCPESECGTALHGNGWCQCPTFLDEVWP